MTEPKYFKDPDKPSLLIRADRFYTIEDDMYCRYTKVYINQSASYTCVESHLGPCSKTTGDDLDGLTEEEFNDALQKAIEEINND